MRNRRSAYLALCAVLLVFLFTAGGCGNEQKEETKIVNPIEITISIDYPDKSELEDIVEVPFKIEEGSTVLDAMQLYCNVNEMALTVETTGASVQGISGVENGDFFAQRTWQYQINGQLCSENESEKVLADGDALQWVYQK